MFNLDTDASNIGICAVLSRVQDKEEKVMEYFSSATFESREELLCYEEGVIGDCQSC